MKLRRILNIKVLKYVLILSIIAAIAYYFYSNTEGFESRVYTCTLPNGRTGRFLGMGYSNLTYTCKTYGVSCPSGYHAGSLNTNVGSLSGLTRCVKDIQMCNDNSDYDELTNTCKDTNSGDSTPLRPNAQCVKGADEDTYVSGSFCQIAKKNSPSCTSSNSPPGYTGLTFNTSLQRCVLPCYDTGSLLGYGNGKYPPSQYVCN
jgi:hypothetical protein